MAVTSGPGGFGINIPINIDFSAAIASLKQYQAAYDAMLAARSGASSGSAYHSKLRSANIRTKKSKARASGETFSEAFVREELFGEITEELVKEELFGADWRAKESGGSGGSGRGGRGGRSGRGGGRPSAPNVSPGATPYNTNIGWRLASVGGSLGKAWQQGMQGGFPSALSTGLSAAASTSWLSKTTATNLVGMSKFFASGKGIPSWSEFTQNRTSNTSYLGSVAGGTFNHAQRFFNAVEAAKEAPWGTGKIGFGNAVAGAAAIYKGLELAARTGATVTAWAMKSGEAAAKHPAGRFFNDAASTFDYVNNYATAVNDSFKMTADFDDTVASVTGKLPDTQKYLPRFFRIAQANLQFEAMVKRNLATTRAGAMGNSDVADQVAHTFFNAAAQR